MQHRTITLLAIFGYALAYFFAAKVGIATSLPPQGIVILWPPNAIVVVALLVTTPNRWWPFLLATVATEVYADYPAYPLPAAIGFGVVNFCEAALAVTLLRRLRLGSLETVTDYASFVIVGPGLAAATAALAGAAIYKISAPDISFWHYWRVFWFGDALGLLVVGTTLLVWREATTRWRRPGLRPLLEATALGLGLLATAVVVFGDTEQDSPRIYLLFPFLLWSAVRFGPEGATISTLMTSGGAILATVNGVGPFAELSTVDRVLALQGLLVVVTLSTLTIAFAIGEVRITQEKLRRSHQELVEMNANLDRNIEEKTVELRHALLRNETLLKEVNHRVKNNLQLVSGMIALRGMSVSDPTACRALEELQASISAIAQVYDLINRMSDVEMVDFSPVVRALCERISLGAGPDVRVAVETDIEAWVTADTAIALSLSLNELITNSIKYGSSDGCVSIAVGCWRRGDHFLVRIVDDGPGLPADFSLDRVKSFGLRTTRGMIQQAGGLMRIAPSERGLAVEIFVPLAQPLVRGVSAKLSA